MKKYFLFLFTLLFINGHGQSLYEIQFTGQTDKTKYTCFLVYYNENDSYMRIKYYTEKKEYRVVEVKYTGESGKYTDGDNYFSLTGNSPRYVTAKSQDESYNPDYFVWIGNEALPYTTDVKPDANGNRTVYKVDAFKKLEVNELTTAYLRSFYGDKEEDYLALSKMSSDYEEKEPKKENLGTTLHLIVIANTSIFDIGKGCEVDMLNLDNEFEDIARTLNIEYDRHLISGNSFSKRHLLNTLDNLTVNSNDITVFVYRGHGFRWSDQTSSYPTLALTKSHSIPVDQNNTILLETVYNTVIAKGGRLNLVMADCCNSDIGVSEQSITSNNYLYMQSNASAKYEKLNELFMNREGHLLFAASEKGEVSWTNSIYGGFFTTSFLQSLTEEISYLKASESSWVNIITNTRKYSLSKSYSCDKWQHAIFYNKITKK